MYNTQFILGFTNDLGELYEIYFDVLNYVGDITQLTGTDDVLTIRSTTGDENKLEPILGTEALINIFVDETTPITINNLIAQHDNDIRVTVYRDEDYSKAVFQGFIVVEDNSQPFLDPPFVLSVRALDGLGLLKKVDLADTNNLLFTGVYSIIEWLAQILYKTDQTLNLRVYFNILHSSFMTNVGALEQTYLDAITFSQGDAFNSAATDPTIDVNASAADDCYTALEKIVRCFRCRLFQEDGVWNLVSLYEYLNPGGFAYTEYSFGAVVGGVVMVAPVSNGNSLDYSLPIGKDQIVHPVQEDQVLFLKLATKWIKLTYTYDQSQNKVCNQSLSEGTRNTSYDQVISSAILDASIIPVVNLQTQGYDIYCWTHLNGVITNTIVPNPFPSSAADHRAYIRAVIDLLGYEKERYLVIENSSLPTYMMAKSFLIDTADALRITVDARTKNSHTGGSGYLFGWALLYGDDGSHWALNCIEGPGVNNPDANKATWQVVDAQFRNTDNRTPSMGYLGINTDNPNTWTTVTCGSYLPAIAPISGRIVFYLVNYSDFNDEIWYKNLSIEMTPYLQGAYTALKGDYNYSSSANNIKLTESDDVEISDSPKRYFKGALVKSNSDLLPPTWHRAGITESFRFTQLMERIMFTHLCRIVQKIEGTFRGLVYVPAQDPTIIRPNGFLNSYSFSDGDVPAKRFMLTSFEKNYATGQWRGVTVETLADQNDTGFPLPDAYQFSYIFQ